MVKWADCVVMLGLFITYIFTCYVFYNVMRHIYLYLDLYPSENCVMMLMIMMPFESLIKLRLESRNDCDTVQKEDVQADR